MVAIRGHFDGKVIVPDEPVDLPRNQELIVHIETVKAHPSNEQPSSLQWIADHAVEDAELPDDLSTNVDHYLYGTEKRNP
jgi:hypothetical protein